MPTAPNPCAGTCPASNCAGQTYDYTNNTGIPKANSHEVCECWSGATCARGQFYFACDTGYTYSGGACNLNAPTGSSSRNSFIPHIVLLTTQRIRRKEKYGKTISTAQKYTVLFLTETKKKLQTIL